MSGVFRSLVDITVTFFTQQHGSVLIILGTSRVVTNLKTYKNYENINHGNKQHLSINVLTFLNGLAHFAVLQLSITTAAWRLFFFFTTRCFIFKTGNVKDTSMLTNALQIEVFV